MATHSSILAWRVPRTEGPDGLQSLGLQRVRPDLVTDIFLGSQWYRSGALVINLS